VSAIPAAARAQEIASTAGGENLYRVRLATGELELVGPTGFEIVALALSPSQGLVAVEQSGDQLLSLDRATGQATVVGPVGVDVLAEGTDLSFDGQGQLWMLANRRLYRVDTTTGAATPALETEVPGIGLAWVGSQLYTADDRLYLVDPVTGDAQSLGPGSPILYTIALGAYRRDVLLSLTVVLAGPWGFYHLETIHTGTGDRQVMFEMSNVAGIAVQQSQTTPVPALGRYGATLLVLLTAASGILYLRRQR
jgi:hypothetical protein